MWISSLRHLPASDLPFSSCFRTRAFFFHVFCACVWSAVPVLCTRSQHNHVVVDHLYTASTSQHDPHPRTQQQSEYVSTRARQRKPAGKVQGWRAPACVSSNMYAARCVLKTNGGLKMGTCPAYARVRKKQRTKTCSYGRSSWHLQSRQFVFTIADLSVRFPRILCSPL